MHASAPFDSDGLVAAGLSVAVELSGDPSLAEGGGGIYRAVRAAIESALGPDDAVAIAVPCVRMNDRVAAILLVLQDRAVLGWSTGLFRKTPHVETVPLKSSWGATIAPGIGARQPVQVLTVQWAEQPPWVLAVPSDAATTRFLRSCFIPAPRSG